jgi:hypothetical protein
MIDAPPTARSTDQAPTVPDTYHETASMQLIEGE